MPILENTRFGAVDYTEEDVIVLSGGMIGFAECTRYLILDIGHRGSFRWLQSLDQPSVAFLVVDPADFVEGYGLELGDDEAASLSIGAETATLLYTTASIPAGRAEDMTLNLAGPIVINAEARVGKQLVVDDDRIPVRHRVFPETREQVAKAA